MRNITKGEEPSSLTQHRCMSHSDYDNYADKDTLRERLVQEQRGLCCYCLSRIRPCIEVTKIAHWHSQASHPLEQLDYGNLLAACKGGEGSPFDQQHCDTHQKNDDISRNPANPAHVVESFVRFEGNGRIRSDDPIFDHELNDILNLNIRYLVNNRKAVLDGFTQALRKQDGRLPRSTIQQWLRDWNGELGGDELKPYCQVVVYWLRKRLSRP